MAIRAKSKKRLIILLMAILVLTGVGVIGYTVRRGQINHEIEQSLARGRAAMDAGDYFNAMHQIGRYSNKHPDNVQVLYEYSQARRNSEEPRGAHLLQTVGALRRILELSPGHAEASHDLMELYVLLGYATETKQIAESLLEKNPDNSKALRAKAVALGRLREFTEALSVSLRFNELKPLDLDGQILTLSLMHSLERSPDEIQARAEELHEQHKGDPRFEYLMAVAYDDNAKNETALKWCRAAASRNPPDNDFVGKLVMMFDKFYLYDESMKLLKTHASETGNPDLFRLLIRRLTDGGHLAELLDRLTGYPLDKESDSEVLALKALTMFRLKRPDEARPIATFLANQKEDLTASAWTLIFDKVIDHKGTTEVNEMIDVCRKALRQRPNHPYFHHYLARAYLVAGEEDLALEQWAKAVRYAPTWQIPMTNAARALMASGREQMAASFWKLLTRGEKSIDAVITIAEIWFANLKQKDIQGAEKLLQVVEAIQNSAPGEARTLVISIALLAQLGRTEEARNAVEHTLANSNKPPSEVTLLKLARISRLHDFDLEEECLARIQELYGISINLVYNTAIRWARDGQSERGLQTIEDAAAKTEGTDKLPWQIARAQYLEAINDPRSTEAWIVIADQFPDNRYVQKKVLHARSTWLDHDFVDRTIQRVRNLYGDNSPIWRVARARWLLQRDIDTATTNKAARLLKDAVRTAPTMVDARTLLADVYRKQGNISAAVNELSIAEKISPKALPIAVIRASLLKQQGDIIGAVTVLETIINNPDATPSIRHTAARLLSDSGHIERAIEIIEGLYEEELPADLLLAGLYRKNGDFDKTNAICRKLLKSPTVPVIQFAAGFFASRGRFDEAEKILALLSDISLPDGQREMIVATFHSQHGTMTDAIEHNLAAINTAPKQPNIRLALISYLAADNRLDEAIEEIRTCEELFEDNDHFKFLSDHIDLIRLAQPRISYRPLIAAMIANRGVRDVAAEALELLRDARSHSNDQVDFIVELRDLTDRHSTFLPLQIMTGRTYLTMEKYDEAISIAARTMQVFPNRVEPIWLMAEALAGAGRRQEALRMARKWRTLAEDRPIIPDLVIGELLIQLNKPADALKQIQPYLDNAVVSSKTEKPAIMLAARAMMASNRADDAAKLLWPLTESSAKWRGAWILFATHPMAAPNVSTQWLERIQPIIPEDAAVEHVTLARAWHTLGVRLRNRDHMNKGLQLLSDRANLEDARVDAVLTLALMHDSLGQTAPAEQGYRRVLKMDANQPVAQNNLSMIIAGHPDEISEAIALAEKAVAARPKSAPFRDTLAQALSKFDRLDRAVKSLEIAITLEPRNVQWPANLTMLYLDHGKLRKATSTLTRIDTTYRLTDQTPAHIHKLISQLRTRIETLTQQAQAGTR